MFIIKKLNEDVRRELGVRPYEHLVFMGWFDQNQIVPTPRVLDFYEWTGATRPTNVFEITEEVMNKW